jgi:hypothetical protein
LGSSFIKAYIFWLNWDKDLRFWGGDKGKRIFEQERARGKKFLAVVAYGQEILGRSRIWTRVG